MSTDINPGWIAPARIHSPTVIVIPIGQSVTGWIANASAIFATVNECSSIEFVFEAYHQPPSKQQAVDASQSRLTRSAPVKIHACRNRHLGNGQARIRTTPEHDSSLRAIYLTAGQSKPWTHRALFQPWTLSISHLPNSPSHRLSLLCVDRPCPSSIDCSPLRRTQHLCAR